VKQLIVEVLAIKKKFLFLVMVPILDEDRVWGYNFKGNHKKDCPIPILA
jgi:hypothetical protein